ncbi:MAG: Gfo/Idh/MocA family oxidoreductase [Verrucomicrobia bacterium]|nr:Gfo/Idh/MocA family oxidoreductase [Verrucomicrobiota bacterium]
MKKKFVYKQDAQGVTRREFLQSAAFAGVGAALFSGPNILLGQSPNNKLNIGVVGCGGKGSSDTDSVSSENIVALCDVDENQAAGTFKKHPKAKKYKDFRKMLDNEKSLDAVVVSTPDHMHAPVAVNAMRRGLHIYCQKPLTHSVFEARLMRQAARKYNVATQMGNQGTATDGLRRAVELLQAGAIGPVHELHVWSNRPIWPQGMDRPEKPMPVPDHLDWDLWIGAAPKRPYHESYCPFNWRGWQDFGTGALGDMACHTVNMPFMGLMLGYPTSIEAVTSGMNRESWPKNSKINFKFPKRGNLPAVDFTWYDGGNKPDRKITKELENVPGSGCMVIGEKGKLYSPNDYGSDFTLFPEKDFADYKGPEPWIKRSPGHYKEWLEACKGGKPAMSNFDYAAKLTEIILLGCVAMQVGRKMEWDGENMRSPNCPEAAQFINPGWRQGWELV